MMFENKEMNWELDHLFKLFFGELVSSWIYLPRFHTMETKRP